MQTLNHLNGCVSFSIEEDILEHTLDDTIKVLEHTTDLLLIFYVVIGIAALTPLRNCFGSIRAYKQRETPLL